MKRQPHGADAVWTILGLLKWAAPYFESRKIDSPRATAEILLAHLLKIERVELYMQFDRPLSKEELACFKGYVRRRVGGEPTAYIVGTRGFWDMEFRVDPNVLIPRPDTECLVEQALSLLPHGNDKRILELGVGSGAVILTLAAERPGHTFFGSDFSMGALSRARDNAVLNEMENRVNFLCGRWFDPFLDTCEKFHMIVSNPPYIPTADIAALQPEVRDHEPLTALDGGGDGLDCLSHLIRRAPGFLVPGGNLLLEMGFDQRDAVRRIITETGCYDDVVFHDDHGGNNRVVSMRFQKG